MPSEDAVVNGDNSKIDLTEDKDGGVLKEIIIEGTGEEYPAVGDKVKVHYVGTLEDGSQFDSSRDRGEHFEFTLGQGQVIRAWDIGVASMKKGEKCILTCKSEYAYGKSGSGDKIPPDSTLLFEVELFSWQGEDLSSSKDGGIIRRTKIKGKGTSPTDGSQLTVDIVGIHNEVRFDEREVTFTLGEGSEHDIPDGIEKALEKFSKGEVSRIYLTSKYAFAAEGNTKFNIPPHADLCYDVTLKSFEKAKDSWEFDTSEKVEQAKLFKEKGTSYFKATKYHLASKQYKKITSYLELETSISEEELHAERDSLMLAAHLNLAACYLKLSDCKGAKDQCDKALEFDHKNVKALFRRGQAYIGLYEPQLAKCDFKLALEMDPSNKAVTAQLHTAVKMIQQQKDKDKATYSNMFDKFAKIDTEKEDLLKKTSPDVMENPGEWGERAKPTPAEPTEEEAMAANLENIEMLNSADNINIPQST